MPLTLRAAKGSPLTHTELDANLEFLEAAAERDVQSTGHEFHIGTQAAQTINPGVRTYFTNDAAAFNNNNLFPGGTIAWDGVNQFDLDNLNLPVNTQFDLRTDLVWTTSSQNTEVTVGVTVGLGGGSEFDLILFSDELAKAREYTRSFDTGWFAGSSALIDFPTRIWIEVDKTTTARMGSHYMRFTPTMAYRDPLT